MKISPYDMTGVNILIDVKYIYYNNRPNLFFNTLIKIINSLKQF